jgi:hypothetical protein
MNSSKTQSLAEKLLDYKPRTKEDLAYLDKFFKIIAGRKGISIVRTNSNTAAWNPDTDVIYLPVFTTDDKDIYLMMGSHEISHAKNTPKTFYKEHNDKKTGKTIVLNSGKQISRKLFGCINIVEDIRIEKLIRQQFPGFVANYRNAYRKLLDYPAFATYKNLTQETWEKSFSIADRINAKAKFGSNIPFPLNDKEYAVLKYCASAKSFDEVLVRALYLHSLLIEEQEQKMPPMGSSSDGEQQDQDQQGGSGDQGNTGDNPSDENLTSDDFKDSTEEGNNQQNQKDSQSGEKNSDKNGDQQNNEKSENGQQKSNKDSGNSSSPDGSDSNDGQPSDELNGNQSQNQSNGSGEQSDGNSDGTENFNGDLSNMMDNLNKEGQSIDKQNSNPSDISNSPKLDKTMEKLQKMIENSRSIADKNESNVTDALMDMISEAANGQLSDSNLDSAQQEEFADEQLEAEKAEEEFKNTENSGNSDSVEIYRTNDYFTAVSW